MEMVALKWWAPALHHSPNEELHPLARQFAAAQGTRAGCPDYMLFIRSGVYNGCAIELKARKPYGQNPTPKHRAWLDHLAGEGWLAKTCFGAEDAFKVLEGYVALGAERPKQ